MGREGRGGTSMGRRDDGPARQAQPGAGLPAPLPGVRLQGFLATDVQLFAATVRRRRKPGSVFESSVPQQVVGRLLNARDIAAVVVGEASRARARVSVWRAAPVYHLFNRSDVHVN